MQGIKTVALLCAALACATYAAEEPSAPAQYDFTYAVNDPSTGDQKDQQETRNGDDVTGYYRTLDSDGYVRTVKYRADAVNGFTAEVIREPTGATVPVPVAAPAVPVVAKAVVKPVIAAPAPYVAPVPYVPAAPAVAPYYYGSSAYPYNYQPYSYGYQPYPYSAAYSPYSYSQYPFNSAYTAPVVRK
ncbi:larval cuticle protein A2B-like [Sipha flava]|uniref:Larval cuticle protein A2B-like n=1 Tax=Sipha flava TaxID=143950 RepID=A0A8B8G0T2_9HEMI|nr:larval cuticle protein A2B-like [Sipha flava]